MGEGCTGSAGKLSTGWAPLEGAPCDPGFKEGLRYRAACPGCPGRNVTPQPRGTTWWTQGPQKLTKALLVTV